MFKRWRSKPKPPVDLSFLSHEEAATIQGVLERDREIQRTNAERLKEIKKKNTNSSWLKGVTGQWFEEIRRAKFKDQTELSKLLKVPNAKSQKEKEEPKRKKGQTGLSDLKLAQSNCPEVDNVVSELQSSDNFKGDNSEDPVSSPPPIAVESDRQNTEALLEQELCNSHKLLQLESQAMFQQLQVRLKPAAVPHVKRKVFMYHDIYKHVLDNDHHKVLGQYSETKTNNAADEQEKIPSTENVSSSELQKSTTDDQSVRSCAQHGGARFMRNKDEMTPAKLSEGTEKRSHIVECNEENARQASDVLPTEQPGDNCTSVDTGHYKADDRISSNSKTVPSPSIIQPNNMLWDQPKLNSHDVPIRSNSIYSLPKNKCEIKRTSLFDLLVESRVLTDISTKQKSCSPNNICEVESANLGEPVRFGSMTGPRSLSKSNEGVPQKNWSDNLMKTSQKTENAVSFHGHTSDDNAVASASDLVCNPHPLLSTDANSRCSINVQNQNVTFESDNISDSSRISQLKHSISLPYLGPGCQPIAASHIAKNIRKRKQHLESNDTRFVTPIKCNDGSLQLRRDDKERAALFSSLKTETPSVNILALRKTRMEIVTPRDTDNSLPGNENKDCKVEGRSNSVLPVRVNDSQLPTADKENDGGQTCASSSMDATLGGSGQSQNAKSELGRELPADPKVAPLHLRNVISINIGAEQGNPSKDKAASLESVNNTLQCGPETSNSIEVSTPQSPNYESQMHFSKKLSSNNNSFTLDDNYIQNIKSSYRITASEVFSYKYQLLDDSSNSTAVTAVDHYKSEPSRALLLPVTTKASPSPSHTIIVGATEIPVADNVKGYNPEATIAPSASVLKQCISRAFTRNFEDKLSENYPEAGHSSIAQQNRCETFSEMVKDWHSTVTKAQLSQGTSLGEGNEYLPKDTSETSSDLKSENSQFSECILAASVDSSQKQSQTNFPLGDITMATIGVENCQPGNNIPFSSVNESEVSSMLTGEHSPSKGHNKADELLFHSPVRLSMDKDLEDYHSENNPTVLLTDIPFGLRASSSIEHGTKSTLQNWESNTNDDTKIGGIAKEYKQVDDSKADVIISLPNVVSEQLTNTDNTYVSQDRCLNNISVSGNRKAFNYLQTLKSEIDTPVVSSRVTDEVSPQSMMLYKDKQLNYLLKAVDCTQCGKSEATCASSSSDLVTSQPPLASTTLSNRCESLNYTLDNYIRVVTAGFNKPVGKFNIKHCSIDPSLDPGSPANIVQRLTDRSMSANLDLPSVQLIGQDSSVSTPNIKKNVLPPSSDEGPSDQSKYESLAETNTSTSSLSGVRTQWYTSNNYPSRSLVHPLDNNGIHVGKSINQYLESKSGTCAASPSSNVLTDTKAAPTNIEINNNALQHDTSNETLHDKTSSDLSEFKLLHETNNALTSPLVTSKRSPKAVGRTSKDYLQPHTPLGGDITMGRGLRVCLEKDKSELLTSDSLTDLQLPLNAMQNITKSPTHFPFIDNISVCSDNEKNVEHCQQLSHNAISPKVSTALTSQTNRTADGVNNVQNVFQSNNDITFYRRTGNSNAQDKSKTLNLIGEQLSTNTSSIPMFSTMPDNKCMTKYESFNYSPASSIMTKDKANDNLQTNTTTTQSPLVTALNSSTSIPQDKVLSLTQSPLITLGAESTKTTENHQYEEKCPVSSQGQQFLSNLRKDQNEPLTYSLKSGELGINENFEKNKPSNTDVISADNYHPSAANITDVTKNTLQHCTTKVTDIYRRKRPSNRFKLNLLHRAKSVPSLSEMTDQCRTDNITSDSKQGRSRTTPLKENNYLLPSEKYQTVSSTDELNKQCILTNITYDRKDKIQKCLSNIEGRIVNRGFDYSYDLRGETKHVPSLISVSRHLAHVDIAHDVENKPPVQVLNYAVDVVFPKSPDDHENSRPVLSRDEVVQPVSPITTAHNNKNKSLRRSSLIADIVLSKKSDNFNTTCVNPSLDPVISQQASSSSFMTLSDLSNNGAVSAKPAVNKCIQKDATETSKVLAVNFQTGLQTVPAVTDLNQNIGWQNRVFDLGCDKMLNEKSNKKLLCKTDSAPSSPKIDAIQHTTCRNQDRTFKLTDEILISRMNNDCIQRNKLEVNTQFSSSASQQLSPSDIKNKQVKSLTRSPVGSDFEMDVADFKNVEKAQSENSRGVSLQTSNDLRFSSDSSTEFLSSSPRNDTFLKRTGINSENDMSFQSPDFIPDPQSLIDVTCSKNRKYVSKPMKIRDGTLKQRWNANCGQADDLMNNNSPLSTSAPVLSPRNTYNHRGYSTGSGSVSPQGNDILKGKREMVRCRWESYPGLQLASGISGTHVTNRHTLNSFQYCSPPKNQIGSEFMEINDLNRLRHSNFSKYTESSFNIDKDNPLVNNYQAGTARFSKNYSRFTRSLLPNSQNAQNRYGQISKDIHSHYNQVSEGDQEDLLSTDSRQNSKLTAQKRHDKNSHLFSNYTKRNRLHGSLSDLSSGGKEFDYNSRPSFHDSLDCNEVVNRHEDTRNLSKEAVKKDTHLEKMKRQRLRKPEIHKKASSPSLEDVFDPFPSEINMDPEMNDQTVKNDEYFPVDIKMFWPKENPTDIIRLFSSTSTGSKISEDSLSPQSYRIPAGVLERKISCYSDTDSDTTTDDEYFLDCSAPAKESAL